jgi:polysaccharide biosynthesis transport protein
MTDLPSRDYATDRPSRPVPALSNRRSRSGESVPGRDGFDGEPASDFRRYGRILRDRWRTVAAVTFITVAGVTIGTFLQTPVYRATGMLEIRQQSADVASVEALYQPVRVSAQYLETQYGVLRSPALARRVAIDLGLGGQPAAVNGSAPTAAQVAARASVDGAAQQVRRGLIIDPILGSSLVRVSFDGTDPETAAQVVNSVFDQYVAMRVEAGRIAEQRLAEQVDSIRRQLSAAEEGLQRYVEANGLVFVETPTGDSENLAHERLRHLQQRLTQAEADRFEKEALFATVQNQGAGFLDSDVVRSLSGRVADLRGEYARLSSTFTDDYPRTRQVLDQLREAEALLARERGRIAAERRSDYLTALQHQEMLQSAFEEQKQLLDALAARSAEARMLRRDVEGHLQLHTLLQQKEKAAGVSAAMAATEVTVVDYAAVPLWPIRPVPQRNFRLALIVGLFMGVGLAFIREYASTTIVTVEEVGNITPVPILGMIPSVRQDKRRRQLPRVSGGRLELSPGHDRAVWHRIDTTGADALSLAEAFAGLRTSVLFSGADSSVQTLIISSSQPGEGKTTVSVNLALSLARLGKRVLLVDTDLRRPSIHRAFQVSGAMGLANYLEGRVVLDQIVRRGAEGGIDLIVAGRSDLQPTELLSSPRLERLLESAREDYDFVILDSPALLINAADTRILAPHTDGVVLVVRSRTTPRENLVALIDQTPNVIGLVVNDVDTRHLPGYYGEYAACSD